MRTFPTLVLCLTIAGTTLASEPMLIPELDEVAYGPAVEPIGRRPYRPDIRPDVRPAPNLPIHKGGDPTAAANKGVEWLLRVQRPDGGWGAGAWGSNTANVPSDVATTAYVVQALRRHADGSAKHDEAIHAGVGFVVKAIESAPEDGPRLNTPQGTQIQHKLGQLVDTHMAAQLLGEVIGTLPKDLDRRANIAYDTALTKVQRAQKGDGSFDDNGWAPVLSTSIAQRSLNQAVANGRDIDEDVLARADAYSAKVAGDGSGSFDTSAGAGVGLYAVAGALATNAEAEERATRRGAGKSVAAKKARASTEASMNAVAGDDGSLMAGFGSAGGEEMLSYQMISDTLAKKGGKEWDQWSNKVGNYLTSTQNADGSWVGHHCITSAVFVTAGAVATLTAENPKEG